MDRTEVNVFKVKGSKQGVGNFKEMRSIVDKDKVYDEEMLDKLFGKSTVLKSSVCSEVFVHEGKVNTEIELVAEEVLANVKTDETPFMHVGCVCIGFMSLARSNVGSYKVIIQDERLKGEHKNICAFKFDASEKVAAFADFPDYCIAVEDLVNGFKLKVLVLSENAMFEDTAHPLAINVVGICRFVDDSLETKMLIKKVGKHMYQRICATEVLDPSIGVFQPSDKDRAGAIMSDLHGVIKKINGFKGDKEGSPTAAQRQSAWAIR
nr:movement protein [Grapevine virus I]WIM49362.1 movement protein [Grapevine virus I]WIM49367.1 movement protein [Grapevine virus I]